MNTHTKTLHIKTSAFFDIIDLTEKVVDFLSETSAKDGLVNVYTRHTTTAIKINEKEDGFFQDLQKTIFQDIANPKKEYHHNDIENRAPETLCPQTNGQECLNGHSHIAQMLLGAASETIPVQDNKMLLGNWQRILMFELDRAKDREVIITFTGECNQ